MKRIKQSFSYEDQQSILWGDLRDWANAKNIFVQNKAIVHIQLKGMNHTITC